MKISMMMSTRKVFLTALLSSWLTVGAFAATSVHLDRAPDLAHNQDALQRGARLFINYCLNCHSAKAVRYNTLLQIGFTEEDIKTNLLFTGNKIGDMMETALRAEDARKWFGVVPPDLSLETRARSSPDGSGADWVYTYLRSFYQDTKSATGWNNTIFPNVAMPHVFWEQQGIQKLANHQLTLDKPGLLTVDDYNKQTGELVAFMDWMAEPYRADRQRIGVVVLVFLLLMIGLSYWLKKEFWKDVR